MDGLFTLLIVFGIVNALLSSFKKKQAAANKAAKQRDADSRFDGDGVQRAKPAQPDKSPKTAPSSYKFPQPAKQDKFPQPEPAKPQPFTGMTDAQRRDSRVPEYKGSLGVTSMEGRDPCHDGETPASTQAWAGEYYPAYRLPALGGEALMNAVVLSEILKRPAERKWGRL